MRTILGSALLLSVFAFGASAAGDVVTAVAGTVKTVDKAGKTVVVKVGDGSEQTFHFVGKTVAHGSEAVAGGTKDAFLGIKEGDVVVVHYTVKGAIKTADEVDHVGKDGMKMTVAVVKSVDHGAKTVTVKTEAGAEDTYHLTAAATRETGKGLDKSGKVTIYYTEEGGKKIAHFFKG